MAEEREQDQLHELMERFEQQQPELARQLAEAPNVPVAPPPVRYQASVQTGTTTHASGLAFVESGTRRAR